MNVCRTMITRRMVHSPGAALKLSCLAREMRWVCSSRENVLSHMPTWAGIAAEHRALN